MKRTKQKQPEKTIRNWRQGRAQLDRWRRKLTTVRVRLKRPRVIDVVPIDFVGGEPVERAGKPSRTFRGKVIYSTDADVTIRRPSGAILVVDTYELVAVSDGKTRFEPQ